MIAILHAYGLLDLAADTELPQEENSKKQDANIINLDFSASFNLPYSPENIQAYDRYGFDKFRCQLYSDGFLIGEYTAKFRENTFNHTDKTGSLTIQLTTLYDSLREDMDAMKLPDALDGIWWEIDVTSTSPAAGETRIHKWLSQEQNTPSGTYPFRFPEYALLNKYEGTFPVPEYESDTLFSDDKFGFGDCVPVNHFNNQYKALLDREAATLGISPLYPDKYVEYNILYDRLTYNMKYFDGQDNAPIVPGVTNSGAGYSHFYRNDPQPRRIWGLACPCLPYLWVLEKSLEKMGLRLDIQWDNQYHKELFENLLILNNYNIFDIRIERIEGYTQYWETATFLGSPWHREDIGMRTYWVGGDNPIFPSTPTSIFDYTTYNVIAKNHVPDITVSNIVDDFIAKTNMEIVLDGNSVIFRKPIIVQDENKRVFNPEIKTQAFEWNMKKKLIYKYEDERDDNIPDYTVVSEGDEEENIESELVPVYLHTKATNVPPAYFSFIVGAPAINKDLNIVRIQFYESHKFAKPGFTGAWAALAWDPTLPPIGNDREVYAEYDDVKSSCPKFCGVLIPYYELPMVGMYYFFDQFAITSIAAPYHLNGRTLKWQDSTGIFENNYKDYLAIFKAKLVHLFSEVYNPETFQRFSHYKFFNLLGRKVFGMKRKYTLPLSKNPLIEYEGYESE